MAATKPRLNITVGDVVLKRLERQAKLLGYPVTTYAGILLAQASLQTDKTMRVLEEATSDALSRLLADGDEVTDA